MRGLITSLVAAVVIFGAWAEDPCRASLVIVSQGDSFSSCVGHAAIRIVDPRDDRDYCFTYECERDQCHAPRYFAGHLKMGMFADKTADFLAGCREDGRGVWEYELLLPEPVKVRLGRRLFELAAAGARLPYSYTRRGCAKSLLDCLRAVSRPLPLTGPDSETTRREAFAKELGWTHPWTLFFLHALVGTETDRFAEVVTPRNLLDYLKAARLGGKKILVPKATVLVPQTLTFSRRWFTPMIFACAFLVVALLAGIFRWCPLVRAVLAAQFLIGLFIAYLMICPWLPNSNCNWLIVLFNPVMPVFAVFRKSRIALIGYSLALSVWTVAMLLAQHAKTDPAYLVIGVSLAFLYGELAWHCGKVSAPPSTK